MRPGAHDAVRFLFVAILASAAVAGPGAAQQDETLFAGTVESGYFSGTTLAVTTVDDATRLLLGARGAWVANRDYALGGGAYWMLRSVEHREFADRKLRFGYGGAQFEYIHDTEELVHFTGHLLVGTGVAWLTGDGPGDEVDWLFVAEPQANVELNVAAQFRIALGLSYRIAAASSLPGIGNGDLGGASFSLTLKSGSF